MNFLTGFEMVLHTAEHDAVKVFEDVFKVAQAAQPIVDLATAASGNAAIGLLYNQTVAAAGVAEQAAITAGLNKGGAQKQAAVIQSIAGSVDQIDKKFGVKIDVGPWVNAAVASLQAVSTAATPAA